MESIFGKLAESAYDDKQKDLILDGSTWHIIRRYSNDIIKLFVNEESKLIVLAIRGTAKLNDLYSDYNILIHSPRNTINFKQATRVLNKIKPLIQDYQVVIVGHSLGASIGVAIGKLEKYNWVKVYAFAPGLSPTALHQISIDKFLCKILRKNCHENITQFTSSKFDPISYLSKLDGAISVENTGHGIDGFTDQDNYKIKGGSIELPLLKTNFSSNIKPIESKPIMTKSVAKLVKAIEKAEKTEESPAPAKKAKRKANPWAMFLKEQYVLQKEKDPKVKFSDVMKSAQTKKKWADHKSK
jgi:hypothetical protein